MKDIALVGLGKFGSTLLEKFSNHGNVKYICGRTVSEKLLKAGEKYGAEPSDAYEKIIDNVDLVVISTPTASHHTIAKACLSKGKDVFVEKPICASLDEAMELINIAVGNNGKIYVDDVFLFRPEYGKLKKALEGEEIEQVDFSWRKHGTFDDSILNSLAYHDIYLVRDLLGFGNLNNIEITSLKDPLETGRSDILEFRGTYGGIPVTFSYNRTCVDEKEKSMKVVTENKTIEWINEKVYINGQPLQFELEKDALSIMVSDLLEGKLDHLRNNRRALVNLKLVEELEDLIASQKSH
jgi:predicted dehydrogenase